MGTSKCSLGSSAWAQPPTTDTQWKHKSKKHENLSWCGRQNILWLYLKIWEWEWIFGRAGKTISSPGVHSPWAQRWIQQWIIPCFYGFIFEKKSTPNPKRIKYNLSYEHEHRKRRNCCYYSLPNGANIAWLYQSDDTSFELRGLMRYTSKAFTAWRPFNVGSR